MNVVRLNFSHGTIKPTRSFHQADSFASRTMNRHVGILLDLQGPKIRTGKLKDGEPIYLETGKTIQITQDIMGATDKSQQPTRTWPMTKRGITFFWTMVCLNLWLCPERMSWFRIRNGGWLKENKGINLPGLDERLLLTPKDIRT